MQSGITLPREPEPVWTYGFDWNTIHWRDVYLDQHWHCPVAAAGESFS